MCGFNPNPNQYPDRFAFFFETDKLILKSVWEWTDSQGNLGESKQRRRIYVTRCQDFLWNHNNWQCGSGARIDKRISGRILQTHIIGPQIYYKDDTGELWRKEAFITNGSVMKSSSYKNSDKVYSNQGHVFIKIYLKESEKASHKMQERIIRVSDKDLIASIYNEFLQINKKKTIRKQ